MTGTFPVEPTNLLSNLPDTASVEAVEVLVETAAVRIERIVSKGQASPDGFWYEQEESEWVAVLRGQARLELRDPAEMLELGPGDWLNIASHRRHRVEWTDPDQTTVWLAVYYR